MTETQLGYIITLIIVAIPLFIYLDRLRKREARMRKSAEKGKLFSDGPKAQHPKVDLLKCIGCGSCVRACPEGDVLGVFGGKATVINGHKCIGHGLCADACPVSAIEMVMAAPSMSADLPFLTPGHETNIPNLFIAGELGGLALIKNAVNQGMECVDAITERIKNAAARASDGNTYDICIVGAGPAGISASLRAIENKLKYITLEQSEIGGTVAKYPRQKLVMTSPVHFPLYGKFRKMSLSKEDILSFWEEVGRRADFIARTSEGVEDIRKEADGFFRIATTKGQYRSFAVVLALGRSGTPRKLEIPGEDMSKVMYRLIEADAYTGHHILVVGGGDSAVEAAMGLANQKGNKVIISYRREAFSRLKERNEKRIDEYMRSGRIQVLFNSNPVEIKSKSVVLDCGGARKEIENDYVWVFVGGIAPNGFLRKIGVQFGIQPLVQNKETSEISVQAEIGGSCPPLSSPG